MNDKQSEKPKESREDEITRIVLKTKKTSYKDLPRISKRITIIDNRENKNTKLVLKGMVVGGDGVNANKNDNDNVNVEEKKVDDVDGNEEHKKKSNAIWDRISNILLCLAKLCVENDESEQNELVYSTLQRVLTLDSSYKRTDQYDQELRSIFESNHIDESEVMRVINGCNQNVIFGAFYQLLKVLVVHALCT